jgi:hypothetical protein
VRSGTGLEAIERHMRVAGIFTVLRGAVGSTKGGAMQPGQIRNATQHCDDTRLLAKEAAGPGEATLTTAPLEPSECGSSGAVRAFSIHIRLGERFRSEGFLGNGWAHPERTATWAVGPESWLLVPGHGIRGDCTLSMKIMPHIQPGYLPSQRLELFANGHALGTFIIEREQTIYARLPVSAVAHKHALCLRLIHPDNARPIDFPTHVHPDERHLAIAYSEIRITEITEEVRAISDEIALKVKQASKIDNSIIVDDKTLEKPRLFEIFSDFQSLGDDCEFGMMQRRVANGGGVGLFRFSSVTLDALIHGLSCEFSDIAEDDDFSIVCEDGPKREFIGIETKYGMRYHTGRFLDDPHGINIREKEVKRLRFLARKLMGDIRGGYKLLVIKRKVGFECDEIARLLSVIRRLGPSTILWVSESDAGRQPGSVEWIAKNLIRGYVGWIAVPPLSNIDDHSWAKVCAGAHQLWIEAKTGGPSS